VITCNIVSPVPDDNNEIVFSESTPIPIIVDAYTTKGSIVQVELFVDDEIIASLPDSTMLKLPSTPYNFTIQPYTIDTGLHVLTAAAFSSEKNIELSALFLRIKKYK
jgi:hypothetical protein